MKNLIAFFEKERRDQEEQANLKGKPPTENPDPHKEFAELQNILENMTKEEQKEIFQTIDIPKDVDVKDAIFRTLKHFNDPDSEMGICFGTVRVKTNAGEVVGTVRVKEGETSGTIRYMGTVKFKDGKETIESESSAPDWADFGFNSVRITRDENDYGTVKCSAIRDDVAFVYRPPEPWEISILALEKGEFDPEMKEEAFGKYRKKRRGVGNLWDSSMGSAKGNDRSPVKRSITDPEKKSVLGKSTDGMEDLRNQLGNVEFVDGGKGSTGSRSRDKREAAEDSESRLKRSTSQEKKKNAIEPDAAKREEGKLRDWAKWRNNNTDL